MYAADHVEKTMLKLQSYYIHNFALTLSSSLYFKLLLFIQLFSNVLLGVMGSVLFTLHKKKF